jgi:hypothetical protein
VFYYKCCRPGLLSTKQSDHRHQTCQLLALTGGPQMNERYVERNCYAIKNMLKQHYYVDHALKTCDDIEGGHK